MIEVLTALPSAKWRVTFCARAAADDAMEARTMGRATATFIADSGTLVVELNAMTERKDRES